jgi:hypothetical protein
MLRVLLCTTLKKTPYVESFVVHDIKKGNTNDILKSICPTMKKKEKA